VDVEVERPGAPDGTGLTRAVKVGPALVYEEITGVGPGPVMRYRMTKGAPVRDYLGSVPREESPEGGTQVSWEVQFRPVVPGTGWLISRRTKRTLNRVLDAVATSSRSLSETMLRALTDKRVARNVGHATLSASRAAHRAVQPPGHRVRNTTTRPSEQASWQAPPTECPGRTRRGRTSRSLPRPVAVTD
jgi:hypothetical protein